MPPLESICGGPTTTSGLLLLHLDANAEPASWALSCARQQRSHPLSARAGRWAGCTRFAPLPEWCPRREDTWGRVRADVLRCRCLNVPCGAAGPHQSTGGFTSVKRFCALIRDRCQSSGAGAPRPPPPHCAEPVSWAPHLFTVHADRPSRIVCRTALSARKGDTETPRISYTTRPPTQKREVMYTLRIVHTHNVHTPHPPPRPRTGASHPQENAQPPRTP